MLFMAMSVFAQEQEAKVRVPSGYQGFLEYGNTWTVFDKEMPNTLGLSTTHGFYFNGHIYAGIGIGFDACRDLTLVPIYGNHGLWIAFLGFMLARGISMTFFAKRNILQLPNNQ